MLVWVLQGDRICSRNLELGIYHGRICHERQSSYNRPSNHNLLSWPAGPLFFSRQAYRRAPVMAEARRSMLQSVGFYFSPLRDADDVASLMEAGSLIQSRAERIVTYLKTKVRSLVVNETEVMELFDRMHAGSGGGERFEAVMTRLPPSEGQVIVTDRTACVIHLQRSFAAGCRQPATGARSSRPRQPSSHITALWAAARCCGCNARSVRRATTTRTRSVATCCLRAVPTYTLTGKICVNRAHCV